MDLGIAGRQAIVCASSSGLGLACATALVREGVDVVINGRDESKLAAAADQARINSTGTVREVAADITTPVGRDELLATCPEPDILVLNNRGPSPGSFLDLTDLQIDEALELHYRAPLAMLRAVLPGMCTRRWGRVIGITSAMVSTPRSMMSASAGARAGQTAVLKSLVEDVAPFGVTINTLLPERIATQRQIDNANRSVANEGVTFDEAWAAQAATIPVGRHGRPEELGATCAFLCSEYASFITGSALHLDGGAYPGLF